jgi:hypothetical protein
MSFLFKSETEVNTPRAITSRSILPNHSSTWLSHEEYVGVHRDRNKRDVELVFGIRDLAAKKTLEVHRTRLRALVVLDAACKDFKRWSLQP